MTMTQQPLLTVETKATGYNKYDLISYFIKSLRLGNKEEVLRIFWVMRSQKISEVYIAKKLVQFATEDTVGAEAVNYAWSTYGIVKEMKSEENALQRLMLYLCDTPKMWESEEEHYWELRRIQIREETKKQMKRGASPLKLSSWVWDKYTARGKQQLRAGKQIDRRFSGVYEGSGLYMRAHYVMRGYVQPEDTGSESAYSPHLLKCAELQMTVDAYLKKFHITAEEFLKSNSV